MALLLSDEQRKYSNHVGKLGLPRESFDRAQERAPLRAFTQLKRCNGICNELPFIGPENVGNAARDAAPMPGVMFEMIRPDLQFCRTHAATLLIACAECESAIGYSCGGIRADCGGQSAIDAGRFGVDSPTRRG